MDEARHILAAQGYSELGMFADALAELESLHDAAGHAEALLTRLRILMKLQDWSQAVITGRQLCSAAPDMVDGYLLTAFCLHELERTEDARAVLLGAPVQINDEPSYHYNLACYESVLGNLSEASKHLLRSIELNADFKRLSETDPDLRNLRNR